VATFPECTKKTNRPGSPRANRTGFAYGSLTAGGHRGMKSSSNDSCACFHRRTQKVLPVAVSHMRALLFGAV